MNDPHNFTETGRSYDEIYGTVVHDINQEHNLNYLLHALQGGDITVVRNQDTGTRMVYLPTIGVSFEHGILTEFPLRFRAFIDALMVRAAEERSRRHVQPKHVKPVSNEHGLQFFMTPKLLAKIQSPPNCSICLDPLIPEGMQRKKVWTLGCGDIFHKNCIAKWLKMDSRCPNCRKDCAE